MYELVYSGKYWNIEFSDWLYSTVFIQFQAEPFYFVNYNKHNQWLCLLFLLTCSMLAVTMPSKNNSKTLSAIALTEISRTCSMVPQMHIHQHKDKSYTLDQHCYILNTLQCYNLNLEFPERETPFPNDYTFSKDN